MSQSYTAQGVIHSIGQTQEFGQNGFTKREFVILLTGPDVNVQYPDHVGFELVKDKCMLMDHYAVGMEIKVHFNLGGRLWAGNGQGEKCFVSLGAWKVEPIGAPMQQAPQQPPQQAPQQMAPQQYAQPATTNTAPMGQPMQQAPQTAPQGQPQFNADPNPNMTLQQKAQMRHPDGSLMYDHNGVFQPAIPF